MFEEQFGDVEGVDAGGVAEGAGGVLGHGQAEHPAATVAPEAGDGGHGVGLARPGRADQSLHPPPRGEHLAGGVGLIGAQPAHPGQAPVDVVRLEAGPVQAPGGGQDAQLAAQPAVGAEPLGPVLVIDALPVAAAAQPGRGGEHRRRVQPDHPSPRPGLRARSTRASMRASRSSGSVPGSTVMVWVILRARS